MGDEYGEKTEEEIERDMRHAIIEEILRAHPELLLRPEIQDKLLFSQFTMLKIMTSLLNDKDES